jgi:DUF1009 family protein
MSSELPTRLAVIAGKGSYPLILIKSAKTQGVVHVVAIAFRGETDRTIEHIADEVHWIRLGELGRVLDVLSQCGATQAVMAGQITPTNLFRVRLDAAMRELLAGLQERNAHTIFGAVAQKLADHGVELLPAYLFMESAMPDAGPLTALEPSTRQWDDIRLGLRVAKTTSGLDVGQTVVIKNGTILAVEAFEGTDATIKRAGRLGGAGAVVVKVAKPLHDMRFDIPVIGLRTLRCLLRARTAVLAVEAGRTILLDREDLLARANRAGLIMTAISTTQAEATGTTT